MFSPLVDYFNAFAKENNIDITVNLELFISNKTTSTTDYFVSVIDTLLKKHSPKYDIYFYDNIYTIRYSQHFIDLKEYLEKEHIDLYPNVLKSEAFSYNNKLIGLVIYQITIIILNKKIDFNFISNINYKILLFIYILYNYYYYYYYIITKATFH